MRQYDIAIAKSRHDKTLRNKCFEWSELVSKLAKPKVTPETLAEYRAMPKEKQGEIKDVGGFVGGYLNAGSRKSGNVVHRSILTLDLDTASTSMWEDFTLIYDCAALVYSTHKHTPDAPRLRLVVPLSRDVQIDEYEAIARKVAENIGIEQVDDTSYEPHRLMYWPSVSKDGVYYFEEQQGEPLDVDSVLRSYKDWRDCTQWAYSLRVTSRIRQATKQAGEPTEKPGIVGAFCRTYGIREAIEKYLPKVYEPCTEDRYTYTEGTTSGGVIVYEDCFTFSHHATDPASGRLCNAFDLVRLHRFGSADANCLPDTPVNRLPSYKAMEELARQDKAVVKLIASERLSDANTDFDGVGSEPTADPVSDEWQKELDVDKRGNFLKTLKNIELILTNDPALRGVVKRDEFNHTDVLVGNLPWRNKSVARPYWDNEDDANLRCYLAREPWCLEGKDKIYDAFEAMMSKRRFHPIRDYLNAQLWDGEQRLETLLIDYLGAVDNELTRAMTRKTFVASVARVMRPGTKWDYILTLLGGEGIGKSTILKRMGGEWFSDSFTSVEGKEAMEQVQRKWLIELGELTNYRRSSVEAYKAFLSKTDDTFRPAYGRKIETYPRQCVFFATTNEEHFLKGDTGNRRWWVVEVGKVKPKYDLWDDLTDEVIGQLWAEALHYYEQGEHLYLPAGLEREARDRQRDNSESGADERIGIIQTYISTLLPTDWSSRSIENRRRWLQDGDPLKEYGVIQRETVCAVEVLAECFGERIDEKTRYKTRDINALFRLMGLKELPMRRVPLYGVQRVFEVPKRDEFELKEDEQEGVTKTCNNKFTDCYSELSFNEF